MAKTLKLWIDADSGYLYQSFNSSSSLSRIEFLQGDKVDVEVHLVKIVNGFMNEVAFPSGSVLRMALGKIDASATSGTYTIAYNGQTTSPLAYSATEAQIQTALNALSTIVSAGGVTVSKFSNSMFSVSFNAIGTNSPFVIDGSLLNPPCSTKSVVLKAGSGSVKGECLIKVKQSPVAYQDSFSDLTQPSISTTILTANQSKRVTISPEPRAGTWSITGTGDLQRKVIASTDGVLNPAWWDENYTARVSVNASATDTQFTYLNYDVTKVDNFTWDFSLKPYATPPVGYTMPFSVSSSGLIGFTGKVGNLDLNTAEIEYLLNGSASVTTNLELELDENGNKRTLLQTTCIIKNDLIDQSNFSPISYGGGTAWGDIGGTISNQTDLQSILDGKLSLTGGTMSAPITFSTDGTNDSQIGAWGLGVENTSNEAATVEAQQITIYDSVSGKGTAITKTGITLAESVFAGNSPSTIIGNARDGDSHTGFNLKTDVDALGARIQITFGNDGEDYENQANLTQSGLVFKEAVSETIFAKYDTSGVTFPDATHQATAALPLTGGELSGSLRIDGGLVVAPNNNNSVFVETNGDLIIDGQFSKTTIGESGIRYISKEYYLDDYVNISAGILSVKAHSTIDNNATPLKTTSIISRGIVFSDATEQQTAFIPANYATLASPTFTGDPKAPTPATGDNDTSIATTAFVKAQNYITSSALTGYATQSYVTSQGYITSSALSPYLTSATASTTYYPLTNPSGYITSSALSGYAPLAGATFTGKVNISAGATTSPLNIGAGVSPSGAGTAGDLWIGGTNLAYKDSTNTLRTTVTTSQSNTFTNFQTITQGNSVNPSLAVTQTGAGGGVLVTNTGAGYSFKVEDSASPDATPFVIDQNGRTGIGVAPDATVALTLDSTGIKVNGATLIPASAVTNSPITSGNMSHSEYTKELLININGVNYAIVLRLV
jgi:hypothetical protein